MSLLLLISIFFLNEFYLKDKKIYSQLKGFIKAFLILGFYGFAFNLIIGAVGLIQIDLPDEFFKFFICG